VIRERLRAGRERKRTETGYAGGFVPFGYRVEGGELIEHDDEQSTIARIRELRTPGVSFRHVPSWRQVCEQLDAEGRKPRRGERWAPATVRRIALRSKHDA
jgi:DNA invertase Pin-like site-specific DNA recombinase